MTPGREAHEVDVALAAADAPPAAAPLPPPPSSGFERLVQKGAPMRRTRMSVKTAHAVPAAASSSISHRQSSAEILPERSTPPGTASPPPTCK